MPGLPTSATLNGAGRPFEPKYLLRAEAIYLFSYAKTVMAWVRGGPRA